MRALFVSLGMLWIVLAPSLASAETLWVNESGLFPFTDIQDAIDVASPGDVVLVFPGTYGPVDFGGIDLVLRAVEPSAPTIVAGDGASAVLLGDQLTSSSLLHGFTITAGIGTYEETVQLVAGGGILIHRGAETRVSGNVIEANSAELGGGIAVVDALPSIDGNIVVSNSSSGAGGGVWLSNPGLSGALSFSCNQLLGNSGSSVGGLFLGSGDFEVRNNRLVGNVGERGGAWMGVDATGSFSNNTLVANESSPAAAAGLETESEALVFSSNLVAFNTVGWGVIRASDLPEWSYNDTWSNEAGDYTGAADDPTGLDGNLSLEPEFIYFTPSQPTDDDLALLPGSPLADLGNPDPAQSDLDGSPNAIGFEGGPQLGCDLDGDGVPAGQGDCRPEEAEFHTNAYEQDLGLDYDCDGWANFEVLDLVQDDGGLLPDAGGLWSFELPQELPGRGHQGLAAWTTAEGGGIQPGGEAILEWPVDLSVVPSGTALQLQLVHAWDLGVQETAVLEAWDTLSSAWQVQASWTGTAAQWTRESVDLSDWAGGLVSLRFRVGPATDSVPGWSVGRLQIAVIDGDGDGRGAVLTDCDDSDPATYEGAPEVPYDGIDQDCDGSDLVDADGDGYVATEVGGDDCDDGRADAFPGGEELPYDGIDQDCDGEDLVDVDGDGHDALEVAGDDCDDSQGDVYPGAPEVPYDGVDQDCDGADLVDVDGDGFDGNVGAPFGDCDDEDPAVHPGSAEICDDQIDNNCDGAVDQVVDSDGDGFDVCEGDCDDTNPEVRPGLEEICDGFDTNCDGQILAGEEDLDDDGWQPCSGDCDDSQPLAAPGLSEVCDGLDNNCDGGIDEGHDSDGDGFSACTSDCDDLRSSVYPGAAPVCDNNLDHDCDGIRDFEQDECQPSGCDLARGSGPRPGLRSLCLCFFGGLLALGRRRRGSAVL